MYFKSLLLFCGALCVCAQRNHRLCFAYGCFESGETQLQLTLDDDEIVYVDFKEKHIVWDNKIPTAFQPKGLEKNVEDILYVCNKDKYRWKPDKSVHKTTEPPDVVLYTRDEVIEDEENTLICFINNFFPPVIHIKWTKNDEEVRVEDPFIKTVSSYDGTFFVFSYLSFVPQNGDVYSCTVDHEALEEPKTRFWDVETDERSSGPAVFCGLGLTLGLLGVAAGTFLFVKGKQPHVPANTPHRTVITST